MKIGLAQISPKKANIESNIKSHIDWISIALSKGVNAVFFPELSITGFEPELSEALKLSPHDNRLNVFQNIANENNITVGIGAPTQSEDGVKISMLIFEPENNCQVYSKQILHEDEKPYFTEGNQQVILNSDENIIAPAICYESLQIVHLENSMNKGANIYLASVAKPQKGIEKAKTYFSKVSKEKSIPILMANSVGYCDNFISAGQSSVWNKAGNIIGQLNESEESILIYDTEKEIAY